MDNAELIERLQTVIDYLNEEDRDKADSELYSIFDDLEFISEDYSEDDEYEEDDDYDEDEDE